jgi:hypothetical protein
MSLDPVRMYPAQQRKTICTGRWQMGSVCVYVDPTNMEEAEVVFIIAMGVV